MLTATSKAQYLTTVTQDRALGTGFLTSVTYNGATASTAGVLLGVLPSLFKQNVIEFRDLTNNVVTFNFNFPATLVHTMILVRATAYTACSA
jgi:hypothetical protein